MITSDSRRRPSFIVTVLLIAAALMVGFGIQQVRYQGQASDRDACYEAWGQELYTAITSRTRASLRVEEARSDRDDAIDNILLLFIAFNDEKPPPTEREQERRFREALAQFAQAKTRLDTALTRVGNTRDRFPYPDLNCE